jgi:PAS domain S-box-containing protein
MDANRVASIGLDISERKRAEEALRENEEMLRLALTAGRAGAWKWDLTTDSLDWSDEYYRIFGFEPGSIPPSAEAGFSRVHPDDLAQIEGAVRQAMERGTQIDAFHRVIWPDGSIHWVRGISRAFFNDQGKPDRMAGIAIDFTEQKQAEIELQAAHLRNVEILESISDAFYSLDAEGRFTYVNRKAASLWGKQPGELLGKNIWEVFPSGKETESYVKIQQTMADRQPRQYESYSRFLEQWIEVHLYPSEGGISVYFQDISNRKRTEAALAELSGKLERSNQELEQFAFVASHDLQEPLRKIEAFGDALLQSIEPIDERARLYVERMRNAAGRMRSMVDGLLQLSRINTQGQPFIRVDLARVSAEVVSDLEYQVQRTGGKLEIDELPVVEGDPLQLRLLLQNLIGNALKYHRPDTPPVVKVYASQLPGRVQILVEDNGIGFNAEEAEIIFQPFQRLVGRSQYEGSGMGLAICRRIVERHGGEITAKGEPGKGASFVVTLPVRAGAIEREQTEGKK